MSRTSAERLELLAKLLAEKGIRRSTTIPKRERGDEAPLSFGQRRLWFLEQLDPGTSLYNDALSVRVTGRALDADLLQRALDLLVERHEILRTSFDARDGDPVQVVHPVGESTIGLRVVDLSGRDEADVEAQLVELVRRPFAFDTAPLVRALLIRRGPGDQDFALAMHHAVSDGVSYGIAWKELGELYAALAAGREPSLPPLPIQYADYAAWEAAGEDEAAIEASLAFWRDDLAGPHTVFGLPTDRPQPSPHEHRGAFHRFRVPDALYRTLGEHCRRHEVTANQVLLAAFVATLAANAPGDASATDVCVATGSTSRTHRELEGLIGFFVRTVLLRVDVSGNPGFGEILRRTRTKALEAAKHEHVPFDRVVKAVRAARGDDEPLLRTWFGHMKDLMPPFRVDGARSAYRIVDGGNARFELSLILDDADGAIDAYFEYDTGLFEASTVAALAEHWLAVLRLALDHPDTTLAALGEVAQLDRLPPAAAVSDDVRRLLIDEFARSSPPVADERTVLDHLADVVTRTPDAVAVRASGEGLTYAQLAARARGVAQALEELGVTPGTFVGVHARRSLDLIVALQGVLEAGAAYLPLPPDYPRERLAFMLEDTQAPVVLVHADDVDTLPETDAHVLRIDEAPHARTSPAEHRATRRDPAYAIYTSGSTGRPKGVPISHANLMASTRARLEYYERAPQAYLLLSSYAFDSSVAGLFWTLCTGGTLVLPTDGFEQDVAALARLIRDEGVTHLLALPALYDTLLEHAPADSLASLTTVIVAGESVPPELPARHFAALPGADLFNEYGPTEGTVWSTVFNCRTPVDRAQVPIGRPIPGAEVYLLDEDRDLVPIGEPGELYVGGPGVAAGYLDRPELTAERFVPHPFAPEAEGRTLYATGDLARFLPDGKLEFLGRKDHQVKIRGHRIELGELDAILARHPQVKEGLVHARANKTGGGKQLVGYVVPSEGGGHLDAAALQEHLAASLPDSMIPASFVFLDELPRLPNGKVDRSRLPAPERSAAFVAPRTDLERVLAGIWGDVLNLERVGVDDDFFELGGHSILATKLFARIVDTLQVEVPLRTLFDGRTIRRLAEAMLADATQRPRIERTAQLVLQLLGVEPEPTAE